MANINLSAAVRSNLGSLQNTASLMSKTSDRLSTGNKVNSALDNPTNFFTASALNSRAGDLNNLMDSMANGIKTIEAANNGLTSITKNLESMQSTLRQARQDKSFQTASYSLDATAIGTTAKKSISFTGGQFDAAQSVSLHNATTQGTGGFVGRGSTLGKDAAITLSSTGLNGGNTVGVNLTAKDTAATSATKINDALKAATGGANGIQAKVVDGQLSLVSSKGESVTVAGAAAEEVGLKALGTATTKTNATIVGAAPAATGVGVTRAAMTFKINGTEITVPAATTTATDAAANGTAIAAAIEAQKGVTGVGAAANAGTGVVTLTDDTGNQIDISGSNTDMVAAGFATGTATTNKSTDGVVAQAVVAAPATTLELKTVDALVNEIANNTDFSGKIRASNDNGKLRVENLSTEKMDFNGVSNAGIIDGTSTGAASIGGNKVRADLAKQFNELRDQLDKLSDDASFNGINLLRGDNLKITFNETGTSSIDIKTAENKTVNAANLGVATTIEGSDLDTDTGIDGYLDQVKTALNGVRSQSSAFGSNLSIVQNRQDFTKSMINTLETGAGNLTLADMNQEAANMMALQTRQSLASSTLSMANQADQGVLQLLR